MAQGRTINVTDPSKLCLPHSFRFWSRALQLPVFRNSASADVQIRTAVLWPRQQGEVLGPRGLVNHIWCLQPLLEATSQTTEILQHCCHSLHTQQLCTQALAAQCCRMRPCSLAWSVQRQGSSQQDTCALSQQPPSPCPCPAMSTSDTDWETRPCPEAKVGDLYFTHTNQIAAKTSLPSAEPVCWHWEMLFRQVRLESTLVLFAQIFYICRREVWDTHTHTQRAHKIKTHTKKNPTKVKERSSQILWLRYFNLPSLY